MKDHFCRPTFCRFRRLCRRCSSSSQPSSCLRRWSRPQLLFGAQIWKSYQKNTKCYQMLPKVTKSYQKLPKVTKNHQKSFDQIAIRVLRYFDDQSSLWLLIEKNWPLFNWKLFNSKNYYLGFRFKFQLVNEKIFNFNARQTKLQQKNVFTTKLNFKVNQTKSKWKLIDNFFSLLLS